MHSIRVEWLSAVEGGRKTIPSEGSYYPIARFPGDIDWPNNAWSVALELGAPYQHGERNISTGTAKFLVKNAPEEKMRLNDRFEIYEGSKKVADVLILPSA